MKKFILNILDVSLSKFILIILFVFSLLMISHGCITYLINPDKPPYTHSIFPEKDNSNGNDNNEK